MEMPDNQLPDSNSQNLRTLTGVFDSRENMEKAYDVFIEKGYTKSEISIIMSDEAHNAHFAGEKKGSDIEDIAVSDIGSSSAIGGTVGVIAGVAVAIGAGLLIPGVGVLVAGPLAVGLAAGGAGGVTGGIIGALVGSGIAEDHAKSYENEVTNGRMVMGIHPRNDEDADYFEKLLRENNAKIIFRQETEM